MASATEAREKSAEEHRRSLEVRADFFEKLSALDAGSIAVAVSVGIALLGKSDHLIGSVHSNLSWLAVIASLLWISLICAIGHNFTFVKIARLDAEQAHAAARFAVVLSAEASARAEAALQNADLLGNHIIDTLQTRVSDDVMTATRRSRSEKRVSLLGKIAVASFLSAYTVVLVSVIRLWWFTR
jgi:hypothetical protein